MDKLEKAIRDFHARVSEAEEVIDGLQSLLDMRPEGRMQSAIWALVGGYKDALDEQYSIGPWLEWWWLECDLGARSGQAGLVGEELRTIATLEDLVQLVRDDRARNP